MYSGLVPWNTSMSRYNTGALSPMNTQPFGGAVLTPPMARMDASQLEEAFQSQEASFQSSSAELLQQLQEPEQHSGPKAHNADELARTAGLLIETVRHETNPKFQNSEFLGFMRQVRDGDVVVDGNQIVQRDDALGNTATADWASSFQASVDLKGKGRAVDIPAPAPQTMTPTPLAGMQSYMAPGMNTLSATGVQDNSLDAYLRQENEEYIKLTADAEFKSVLPSSALGDSSTHGPIGQVAEWNTLQRDWDAFEATATGIRPVTHYQFQAHNPYVLGEASRTRHHLMHSQETTSLYESVLELEAAVQRDPTNALRWFELGVKQQENEREHKAIQALQRALELDPTHLPSWLALAVSYTNDSNRAGAYGAIREWVERNEPYRGVVDRFRAENPDVDSAGTSQRQRFETLVKCLIEMAREAGSEVDADTQIALAVLLNTSEEYEKAKDCFNVALAVRPEDWLLYNRVGATLANSGNPEEALQYYYRALELNPVYIRARFNLGISCINLRRYDEGAQHILDALILQDGDNVREPSGAEDKRGVTSSALWDSLKTCCLHIQRLDLATLCDRQDLEAFRLNFQL
ncbi:hypothetical protein B0H21DRAFT_773928 [Amylocystis lapponica]|nr:hypothetical protein B0H21DRAFT_773928 [Amylocystis lapponica]